MKSMEKDSFVFIKNSFGEIQKLDERTHIFLCSRCASNYWHFLIEDAARLVVFKENNLALTNPTIIIPGDATRRSAEIISRIYPQSEILRLENDGYYSGHNVFIPSSHLLLDDEPRFGVSHTFNYSKDHLHKLRSQILIDGGFPKPKFGNRFYVRRKSGHRLIAGEEELIRRLLEQNFAVVDLAELDFMDQAALFFRAEIVIGAAGAGWANLIFSPEGTRVLSLIGIDAAPWDMHEVIARDLGLDYQQLILDHVNGDEFFYSNYLHRDVRITEDDIANVFTWICS